MKVALYTRVSTDEQAKSGYSLEDQLDRLEAHATSQGWEVVARIQDDGLSGSDPGRPGLLQILRLATEGRIDAALATKRDRFYRSRLLRLATDEDFKELGVRLVALDDTGNMIGDSVLDSFAEWEREVIIQRTRDGRLKKARKGEVPGGGYAPFGFSWVRNDNDRRAALVVNQDMLTVRRIFDMVACGDTLGKIAESLRGVPTPRGGTMWYPNTLARIVRNEAYKGVYYYGKERVERTPGRKMKRRATPLPQDQWIAVPVADSGIPHGVIDEARRKLDAKYRPRPHSREHVRVGRDAHLLGMRLPHHRVQQRTQPQREPVSVLRVQQEEPEHEPVPGGCKLERGQTRERGHAPGRVLPARPRSRADHAGQSHR
jgi:site-specific DNA recombinase